VQDRIKETESAAVIDNSKIKQLIDSSSNMKQIFDDKEVVHLFVDESLIPQFVFNPIYKHSLQPFLNDDYDDRIDEKLFQTLINFLIAPGPRLRTYLESYRWDGNSSSAKRIPCLYFTFEGNFDYDKSSLQQTANQHRVFQEVSLRISPCINVAHDFI